jgi:uncharacterized GH25 family protein
MNLKKTTAGLLLVAGLTSAMTAQAHRAWLLPSATVLSGETAWVTFDGAISNSLFYFEHHALDLDGLVILDPDGEPVEAQNKASGKYRSVFDAELVKDGTHTFEIHNQGVFGSYLIDGERKRWRGTAEDVDSLPANAEELRLTEIDRRMQVFVTKGAPTDKGFTATGEGLEMLPVTHPNDLFTGEKARFRFRLDGQPAANLEVLLIRDGIRYRDQVQETRLTTDSQGQIAVTFDEPGMYWMEVEAETPSQTLEGGSRRLSYSATLEVLPL